jgi:hypothetical protein
VLLDTFRALAGVIVMLVKKARKRQVEVCVQLVMQEKQIRRQVSKHAFNVRKEHFLQALVCIIAHCVTQEHIKRRNTFATNNMHNVSSLQCWAAGQQQSAKLCL